MVAPLHAGAAHLDGLDGGCAEADGRVQQDLMSPKLFLTGTCECAAACTSAGDNSMPPLRRHVRVQLETLMKTAPSYAVGNRRGATKCEAPFLHCAPSQLVSVKMHGRQETSNALAGGVIRC